MCRTETTTFAPPARLLLVSLSLALAPLFSFSFDISAGADRDLGAGADLVNDGATETIQATGTGTTGDPYVYDWDDINGGGTDSSDDLVLGANSLLNTDGTSFTLKLTNGNGAGTITGNGATSLSTTRTSSTDPAGDIAIYDVGAISIGGIDTRGIATEDWRSTVTSGKLTIGADGTEAGNVRITHIHGYSNSRSDTRGAVIYSSGFVKIQDQDADVGSTLGDIRVGGRAGTASGDIQIMHNGAFRARDVRTDVYGADWSAPGQITLDGNENGVGSPSGTLVARDILADNDGTSFTVQGTGIITIRGYTSVSVSNLWTYHKQYNGQPVSVTNIAGNIDITGTINLNGDTDGDLTLGTTGAGTITLAELDLDQVGDAAFSSGSGKTYILGALQNFDTGTPGANGLDAASGQKIYYNYTAGVLNDYLGGQTYSLPSGGRLMTEVFRGTVIRIQ